MEQILNLAMVLLVTILTILNRKHTAIMILLFMMAFLIVRFPSESVIAAKKGLELWLFTVVPSLLPFFVISDMLVTLKVPDLLANRLTKPAKLLFGTSGYGAYVFVMSLFSGYPAGARIVTQLMSSGNISVAEGQRILCFASTSGPLFVIGVVGAVLLKSPELGYLMFLFHMVGAILNGILYRILDRNNHMKTSRRIPQPSSQNELSTSTIFADALMKSLYTCGLVGGYVVMFSVILGMLDRMQFFGGIQFLMDKIFRLPETFTAITTLLAEASLELSNGSVLISGFDTSMSIKLSLLSFLISFSGVAVLGQVAGIAKGTGIRFDRYVLAKLSHGVLSALVCFLAMKMPILHTILTTQSVSTTLDNRSTSTGQIGIFTYVIFVIISLGMIVLFKRESHRC